MQEEHNTDVEVDARQLVGNSGNRVLRPDSTISGLPDHEKRRGMPVGRPPTRPDWCPLEQWNATAPCDRAELKRVGEAARKRARAGRPSGISGINKRQAIAQVAGSNQQPTIPQLFTSPSSNQTTPPQVRINSTTK